jgi:D-3-phosphoglycerate dehydrogenase
LLRKTLRRMKSTAIFINTARDPIVEDAAIDQALTQRWIADEALDDLEEEPTKQRDWHPANPLFQLQYVIITPHAAPSAGSQPRRPYAS